MTGTEMDGMRLLSKFKFGARLQRTTVLELNPDSSDGIPKTPRYQVPGTIFAGLETGLQVTETVVRLGKTISLPLGFNSRELLHSQNGGHDSSPEVTEMFHSTVNGTTGCMS